MTGPRTEYATIRGQVYRVEREDGQPVRLVSSRRAYEVVVLDARRLYAIELRPGTTVRLREGGPRGLEVDSSEVLSTRKAGAL